MKKRLISMFLLISIVCVGAVVVFAGDKKLSESAKEFHDLSGIPKAITSASAFGALGVHEYHPRGRRDPFTPLVVEPKEVKPKKVEPKEVEPRKGPTPLERYDVTEFKLIATLWNEQYYAVVTLPDGRSHTIRDGTKLGLHEGKVYKITKDSVVVKELLRGILKPRDTILKLREEEER